MTILRGAAISALTVSLAALSGCNNIMPQKTVATKPVAATSATANMNLLQVAQSNSDFSLLVEAVQAAGLTGVLANPNANFTIFAPTNDAFVQALQQTGMTKAQLFANKPLLTKILGYHVINGNKALYSSDLKSGNVMTLSNDPLMVTATGQLMDEMGRTTNIIKTDIKASNGVIHVIDHVLMPK